MPDATRLTLVRHGESNVMVKGVVGGVNTCDGLSALGRLQAAALRDRLARSGEIKADVLIASTLPRARETAEIIQPALGGIPIIDDPEFIEVDPGPHTDGMRWEDVVATYGEPGDNWDPFNFWMPGAESWVAFSARIGTALGRVLREHQGKSIVIACHGGVIDASLRWLLNMGLVLGFELHTRNTSLTELERIRPDRWRLHRYNDASHLERLPASTG